MTPAFQEQEEKKLFNHISYAVIVAFKKKKI